MSRLRDDGVAMPDGPRDLLAAATVERLTGPANASDSTPLTVVHRISWSDPELAARYADAWADTTVEQVRATLLADLEPARAQTVEALEAREAALAEAEAAYRSFRAQDLPGIEQELRTIGRRIATSEDALSELDRSVAGLSARREALLAMSGVTASGAASGTAAASAETLDLLADTGRLDPAVAAQLRLLATEPGDGVAGDPSRADDAIALLARADLHAATVELAGALQEREQLRSALATSETRAETLRDRVAGLRQEDARLSRRTESASAAFQAVQAIEPALAFVANLTPGNTRVLNSAQEPTEPTGPSARLLALIAAVVAGLAATLFVFLREAVREPADEATRAPERASPPNSRPTPRGA
ncbi:MAG: GNVR domain-containing protein [Trueperaceae bacterium]